MPERTTDEGQSSMVKTMCGVQLKERRVKELTSILGLNETMDQLSM